MKILIYTLTFIIGTIINTFIGILTGIKAGAALLYIIEIAIARKIWQKIESKNKQKNLVAGVNHNITVQIVNGGWRCPCCGTENLGTNHCERCGILPKFK